MSEGLGLYCQLMMLLLVANGAPVILQRVLKERWAWPVDGGRVMLLDGRRWLGRSITWRGLVSAVLATGLAAVIMNLPFSIGLVAGAWAMAGDLLSSFIKRRLNLAPGDMALGLDQIPESLLPLLAIAGEARLEASAIASLVLVFIGLELLLSRLLYALEIRERPY
jgi:hypothetical protein